MRRMLVVMVEEEEEQSYPGARGARRRMEGTEAGLDL